MVSSLSLLENRIENKHVESSQLLCLDPGSTPGSSTTFSQLLDNQGVANKLTANFPNEPAYEPILAFSLKLFPLEQFENTKPFKLARLYNAKGDINSRWYIVFYVWDEKKNKQIRKKDYTLNKFNSLEERKAYAQKRISDINNLLKKGYYLKANLPNKAISKKEEASFQVHNIKEAFQKILEIKSKLFRKKTFQTAKSKVGIFIKFIQPKLYLHQLTDQDLIKFSDYLLVERELSTQSRNDYLRILKSLLGEMVTRNWIMENPFQNYKKMRVKTSAKNKAYSKIQQKQILDIADDQLKLTIQFIFYCFMRPNEIRLLQIKNINLKEKRIFIPGDVAKNNKGEYVTIPSHFLKNLSQLKLDSFDSEHYLIGKTSGYIFPRLVEPSDTPFSINKMGDRHRKVLKELEMSGGDYTLYGWKHTGVVSAYKAGVDIKSIQFQCRHYSLEMTDRYLKSLGLFKNNEVFEKMPEL